MRHNFVEPKLPVGNVVSFDALPEKGADILYVDRRGNQAKFRVLNHYADGKTTCYCMYTGMVGYLKKTGAKWRLLQQNEC